MSLIVLKVSSRTEVVYMNTFLSIVKDSTRKQVCLRVLSLTTNKKVFMHTTSVLLETFSTISDIINLHFKLGFSLYNWMLNYFKLYCTRYGIPQSLRLYCTLYMFCIGLMKAVLRPKHVALIKLMFHHCVDIHMLCFRQ